MIRVTQGDNYPTITAEVTYENDGPVDLTGASAVFSMTHNVTGHVYTEICNINVNVLSCKLTPSSTIESGVYKCNFLITLLNGDSFSVPNDEYIDLVVKKSTNEVGAVGAYTTVFMRTEMYDQDADGIVDKAEKLDDGFAGKSYTEIHAELVNHTAIPAAHHSNTNDPTTDQKAALNAATTPNSGNKFVTDADTTVFMRKATYDANNDGVVDAVPWAGVTGKPSTFTPATHSHVTGDVTSLLEYIQDTLAATVVAGNQMTCTYNDTAGTLTIAYNDTPLSTEAVQDIVGALIQSGTGITATYDDATNALTISYNGTAFVAKDIKDIIGANITGSNGIVPSYNSTTGILNIDYEIASSMEAIRDSLATFIVPGSGLTVTHNDAGNTLTLAYTGTPFVAEDIQDIVGAMVRAGTGISVNYDDVAGTFTISYSQTPYTAKNIKDIVGAMVTGSNGVTPAYNDTTGVLDLGLTLASGMTELIQDMIGSFVTAGSGILTSYDDAAGTFTITLGTHTHAISGITGLQTALNLKLEAAALTNYFNRSTQTLDDITNGTNVKYLTAGEKTKLDGIAAGADVTPSDVFRKTVDTMDNIVESATNKRFTAVEKTKLGTVANNANYYILPTAAADVIGGIKVGARLTITNGVLSADIQDGAGDMTEAEYVTGLTNSTHYVDTSKALLDGTNTPKTYADINGALTTHTGDNVIHHTKYTDAEAVSAVKADAAVADAITKKHSHGNSAILDAITNIGSGIIISAAERTKLNGIATGANAYTLPIAAAGTLGGIKIGSRLTIDGNGILSADVQAGGDMMKSAYDTGSSNITNVVDTADKLLNGAGTKSYADIAGEIDGDIASHAANPTAHHTNVNDPTASQKAAFAGTSGTPSDANRFVTNDDSRMTNARTPSAHTHTQSQITDFGDYEPAITKLSGFNLDVGTTTGTLCAGDDSRLTNNRTPSAHASTHAAAGTDPIKLDDLGVPDDNTDLNASTARHGLLAKLPGGTTNYLRADGSWASPSQAILLDTFTRWEEGTLATTVAFMPHMVFSAVTISSVKGYLLTLPVGQSVKIDIRKNNPALATNSIFTGDIPGEILTTTSVVNGVYQFNFTSLIDSGMASLTMNDVLYIVVTQVGTTTAGTGLYIKVAF